MAIATPRRWKTLGRWNSNLYLIAGALLVGYAALKGVAAVTGVAFEGAEGIVAPAGLLFGFVGLLGLYPGLVDRSPVPARVGAVCATLGTAAFAVAAAVGLAELAGIESWSPPAVALLLGAVGMIPGYLSFALASVRASEQLRAVGLSLLAPAVVFTAMLSQPFVYGAIGIFSETTMAWSNFTISSCQAVAHLGIAYTLRAAGTAHDSETPSTDVSPS